MGVFVDYTLGAECTDSEVRSALERIRSRCMDLPLKSVGKVIHVEPVYSRMYLLKLEQTGYTLPKPIKARVRKAERSRANSARCVLFLINLFGMEDDFSEALDRERRRM